MHELIMQLTIGGVAGGSGYQGSLKGNDGSGIVIIKYKFQ